MIYLEKPEQFENPIEVVGCFVEHNGKILMLRRHPAKAEGLSFGRPSGKLDSTDKDKKHAISRELFEETAIRIAPEDFEEVATFYVPNGLLKKNFIFHNYKVSLDKLPEISLSPEEHIAHVWVTQDEAMLLPLMVEEDNCLKYFYGI
jgi:8-oxo-dGTP pyrophosphatase MutT (NUDIX family)